MLTEKARDALMIAYGDQISLYPDEWGIGAHPNTIRSLVKKGLIAPDEDDDFWCEYDITDAGKIALGIVPALRRPPKRLKTAICRAIGVFLEEPFTLRSGIFTPDKIHAVVWVNDEQQADYSEALMVVDLTDADLYGFEDHWWACVGQLVRDMGFEVYADVGRQIVAFWSTEDGG
jgi:hypothetical protein